MSDADAERYIKIFTSLDKAEIDGLVAEHNEAPHLRVLQKRLAKEVTVMVHSEEDYNAAVDASNILFGNATSDALKKLDEDTLLAVFEGVPQFEISRDALVEGVKAVDLFVDNAAVFASKGEMRKLVQGGGVSLNKEKLAAFDQVITTADLLDEKYLLVERGKKNYLFYYCKVKKLCSPPSCVQQCGRPGDKNPVPVSSGGILAANGDDEETVSVTVSITISQRVYGNHHQGNGMYGQTASSRNENNHRVTATDPAVTNFEAWLRFQ